MSSTIKKSEGGSVEMALMFAAFTAVLVMAIVPMFFHDSITSMRQSQVRQVSLSSRAAAETFYTAWKFAERSYLQQIRNLGCSSGASTFASALVDGHQCSSSTGTVTVFRPQDIPASGGSVASFYTYSHLPGCAITQASSSCRPDVEGAGQRPLITISGNQTVNGVQYEFRLSNVVRGAGVSLIQVASSVRDPGGAGTENRAENFSIRISGFSGNYALLLKRGTTIVSNEAGTKNYYCGPTTAWSSTQLYDGQNENCLNPPAASAPRYADMGHAEGLAYYRNNNQTLAFNRMGGEFYLASRLDTNPAFKVSPADGRVAGYQALFRYGTNFLAGADDVAVMDADPSTAVDGHVYYVRAGAGGSRLGVTRSISGGAPSHAVVCDELPGGVVGENAFNTNYKGLSLLPGSDPVVVTDFAGRPNFLIARFLLLTDTFARVLTVLNDNPTVATPASNFSCVVHTDRIDAADYFTTADGFEAVFKTQQNYLFSIF